MDRSQRRRWRIGQAYVSFWVSSEHSFKQPRVHCERKTGHRGPQAVAMLDFFWSVLNFIGRAINFALELWISISRLQRFGRFLMTGRAYPEPDIKVPPNAKIPTAAAQRALDEAEQRRNREGGAASQGKL